MRRIGASSLVFLVGNEPQLPPRAFYVLVDGMLTACLVVRPVPDGYWITWRASFVNLVTDNQFVSTKDGFSFVRLSD